MKIGPVMLDLEGEALTKDDIRRLNHPACGGIILFSRNYIDRGQIAELVAQVRAESPKDLLVCVDHEGGRVQRFRDGFTRLPPAAWFGLLYDAEPESAKQAAREVAWLLAAELRSVDIDFSFAPVLDIGFGICDVIGNRAFHRDPRVVAELATASMMGMHDAGMAATGKHFPGHGGVTEDSHLALPVDHREAAEIMQADLIPFTHLINAGLEAVMPAHVIYRGLDMRPAGFSSFWLQTILREQLHFDGVIFSDDLSMAAAQEAGSYADRAHAALEAGCDMVLVCNNQFAAEEVLDAVGDHYSTASERRLTEMLGKGRVERAELEESERWRNAVELANKGVEWAETCAKVAS